MSALRIHPLVLSLALLALAPPSWAEDHPGVDGLRVVESLHASVHLAPGESLMGLSGFHGTPLPTQWLVLTRPHGAKGFRERVFSEGRFHGERSLESLAGQDLPRWPIQVESLRFSSADAFALAKARAESRGLRFERVHYQLRVRDEGLEPVWMLILLNRGQAPLGRLYISALQGTVLRESWARPMPTPEAGFSSR